MIRVLDVGCGNEINFTSKHEVTHVDIKPGSFCLEAVCDGYNLPFQDKSFDIVHCSHVLEHLINPGLFLKELIRVLRVGLVVRVPNSNYYRVFFNSPNHVIGWSIYNLRAFLKPYFRKVRVFGSFRVPSKQSRFRTFKNYLMSFFFGRNEIVAVCIK